MSETLEAEVRALRAQVRNLTERLNQLETMVGRLENTMDPYRQIGNMGHKVGELP